MKKIYHAPQAKVVTFHTEDTLLSGSKLSSDGSENIDITVSDEEYDGTFQSNQQDWGTSAWNED